MNGAIFDVDGTLLDSMIVWENTARKFFEQNKIAVSYEEVSILRELTLEAGIEIISKKYNTGLSKEEIFSFFKDTVAYEYAHNIPIKPGAYMYLKKLHDDGVRIAIATSNYEKVCKATFARLGILDFIDAYAFSYEVGCNKDNPDVYLLAAEKIGLKPEECTVYEDIVLGIKTARKAGFKTCAVADITNKNETEALKKEADKYINNWTELL